MLSHLEHCVKPQIWAKIALTEKVTEMGEPRHEGRPKNERAENFLRAVEFKGPKWIPARVGILPATWKRHREELERIILGHPKIFPDFKPGSVNYDAPPADPKYRKGRVRDKWGCVWQNIQEGMYGVVVEHPLSDWSLLDNYKPPDPEREEDFGPLPDWEEVRERFEEEKRAGRLAVGGMPHGFMYMRLYYLRGFENFMIDVATDDPRLERLIGIVLDYNVRVIRKWLDAEVELMSFGDDLGMQDRLPISPEKWRKYLKPCYAKMFGMCREEGVLVFLHSDGHILEIIPDLIECGVTIITLEVKTNPLDSLAKEAKGKVCIDLDLDRQMFPFATPQWIRRHIKGAIEVLALPEGGLTIYAEISPDVPLRNIEAICDALEEHCGPWWG